MKIFIFFHVILMVTCFFSFSNLQAKSCEANNSCKTRFHVQNDPYDIQRESSRGHVIYAFTITTVVNRIIKSEMITKSLISKELSMWQRIFYASAISTSILFLKDFVYDPDGLSRSDMANNLIGISLSIPLEISL